MSRASTRLLMVPMLARHALRGAPAEPPRRILIAHQLLLGDTLMLAPLLAKLRAQYPAAEIVMLCPPAILPLFAAHPYGVTALPYAERHSATLKALWPQRGFDLALIPAENRMAWLARALGSRRIVAFGGDDKGYKNWLVDRCRPWPTTPTALPDIFATLVDGAAPASFQPTDWPWAAAAPFAAPTAPYAVLHVGASNRLRYWEPARWTALAGWLAAQGIQPVWSAGAKEVEQVALADPAGTYASYGGKLDLLQLAHLLKGARLLVSPDTGVAHLARLTGTPALTLYGPGSPVLFGPGDFWRHAPLAAITVDIECRDQRTLFRRELDWVRRCGRGFGDGPNQCPRARCMEGLALDAVTASCRQLLADTGGIRVSI
ncbi:MAG: glycosyltransferase family 9 protein [Rhodocyclaceae bacterium]